MEVSTYLYSNRTRSSREVNDTNSKLLHRVLLKFSPYFETSLIAQLVKNLPAMQETLVRFLGQEDPLEKG